MENRSTNCCEEEVKALKERCLSLDAEIQSLVAEGLDAGELQVHVNMLHQYNEIKDCTQEVMGKIALLQGVTIKELHQIYELDMNE